MSDETADGPLVTEDDIAFDMLKTTCRALAATPASARQRTIILGTLGAYAMAHARVSAEVLGMGPELEGLMETAIQEVGADIGWMGN